MKAKTITKLIGKLEHYMDYQSNLPIECTNVGILAESIKARAVLIKELECQEDIKDEA